LRLIGKKMFGLGFRSLIFDKYGIKVLESEVVKYNSLIISILKCSYGFLLKFHSFVMGFLDAGLEVH
jgi:hypothetical protein